MAAEHLLNISVRQKQFLQDKPDIAAATAMAGEMLGLSMIYLEAGSGAENHVPLNIIKAVRENISIPIVCRRRN